jgi:hypothetical protein
MKNQGITIQNIYYSLQKVNYGGGGAWITVDKNLNNFWNCMKPVVNEIMKSVFEKINYTPAVKYPVIHFRCSDVPFVRNSNYGFQKYSFFKDSLDYISEKNGSKYDTVYISYCNIHRSNPESVKACDVYSKSLSDYLESIGYKTIIQCGTNVSDFGTLFYAPGVISTSSSFSFMSGFFSDGVFVSEGHYHEKDGNQYFHKCTDCDKWLKRGYNIKHDNIPDYYDTEKVIAILKN